MTSPTLVLQVLLKGNKTLPRRIALTYNLASITLKYYCTLSNRLLRKPSYTGKHGTFLYIKLQEWTPHRRGVSILGTHIHSIHGLLNKATSGTPSSILHALDLLYLTKNTLARAQRLLLGCSSSPLHLQ